MGQTAKMVDTLHMLHALKFFVEVLSEQVHGDEHELYLYFRKVLSFEEILMEQVAIICQCY